ncbi:hypothetical protein ACFFRR_011721 [Megaselia abdita]
MSGAPPPPPLPNLQTTLKVVPVEIKKTLELPFENESLWARDFPEIQKACYFSNSRLSSKPKRCEYYKIPSILQVGPTCGLTAVSMMLLGKPTPDEILEMAKSRRFTNFGEMFSAENLHSIAVEVIPEERTSFVLNCDLNSDDFKKELLAGSLVLVAYLFLIFPY